MEGNRLISVTVVGLVLATFAGGIGGFVVGSQLMSSENDQPSSTPATQEVVQEESAIISAIENVQPAVVSIVATKDLPVFRQSPFGFNPFFNDPFAPQRLQPIPQEQDTIRQQVSGGTGFLIKEDGLLVTNKHVVSDETADYTVVFSDGRELPAEVVSRDPANDIAFAQIYLDDNLRDKPADLPILEFGSSESLQIGQRVIAIGNALGEFQNSVTAGIISAKERQIQAMDQGGGNPATLNNLLQTDAAINQGNSGGPLIDLNGRVIGVNTAIASGADGIGFAIAIDDVKPVLASLERYGEIRRPQLGVRFMMLNEAMALERGLRGIKNGALLVGEEAEGFFAVLPGSPADKAGLTISDVILRIDGKELTQEFSLQDAIRRYFPGDRVTLEVWRAGDVFEVEVELESVD